MLQVFVYGTLKPGEANYHLCEKQVLKAEKAIALGELYALPMGYPAMTLGNSKVHGYLLTFADEKILTVLDDLEDYDSTRPIAANLYNRQSIEIFDPTGLSLGWVWVYLMTQNIVNQLGGVILLNGCWDG